ncbi:hypothetical protein [Hymenobacter rubidus]|uniref:hypothetical protein n=1 Tax=Hymenobacter rubidus TaxID=1441626 RepID=UPI00191E9B5E|nr:hypothetical protein [Hymenobacter rubidus]
MQSLSNYNYRQGSAAGWISYAGQLRQQPAAAEDFPSADAAASHSSENPSASNGQISDPALDGRAAAAGEH